MDIKCLPRALTSHVYGFLDIRDHMLFARVSSTYNQIAKLPTSSPYRVSLNELKKDTLLYSNKSRVWHLRPHSLRLMGSSTPCLLANRRKMMRNIAMVTSLVELQIHFRYTCMRNEIYIESLSSLSALRRLFIDNESKKGSAHVFDFAKYVPHVTHVRLTRYENGQAAKLPPLLEYFRVQKITQTLGDDDWTALAHLPLRLLHLAEHDTLSDVFSYTFPCTLSSLTVGCVDLWCEIEYRRRYTHTMIVDNDTKTVIKPISRLIDQFATLQLTKLSMDMVLPDSRTHMNGETISPEHDFFYNVVDKWRAHFYSVLANMSTLRDLRLSNEDSPIEEQDENKNLYVLLSLVHTARLERLDLVCFNLQRALQHDSWTHLNMPFLHTLNLSGGSDDKKYSWSYPRSRTDDDEIDFGKLVHFPALTNLIIRGRKTALVLPFLPNLQILNLSSVFRLSIIPHTSARGSLQNKKKKEKKTKQIDNQDGDTTEQKTEKKYVDTDEEEEEEDEKEEEEEEEEEENKTTSIKDQENTKKEEKEEDRYKSVACLFPSLRALSLPKSSLCDLKSLRKCKNLQDLNLQYLDLEEQQGDDVEGVVAQLFLSLNWTSLQRIRHLNPFRCFDTCMELCPTRHTLNLKFVNLLQKLVPHIRISMYEEAEDFAFD